jgi:hypothetical protein
MPGETGGQNEFREAGGISTIPEDVALGKLKQPIALVSWLPKDGGAEPLAVKAISGFEGEGVQRQTIHYLVLSPELNSLGLTITRKDGGAVRITAADGCLPIDPEQVQTVAIGDRVFKPRTDPWENLGLLESKPAKIDEESQRTLNQIVQLWQAALAGEENLGQFLQANMDREALAEVQDTLAFLKNHPLLQKWHYDLAKIDAWRLADLPSLEQRKEYLKKIGVSFLFMDSEEFGLLMRAADKIQNKQDFTAEDVSLLNALALAEVAVSGCAQFSSAFYLTPLNERFALANIAENYFMRGLVPVGTFSRHQQNYLAFSQIMAGEGEEMPEWFSPYRGDEFRYAPAISGTIANAGGKYFFNLEGETADSMAGILDHERIHFISSLAKSSAQEFPKHDGFRSDEAFTECLALLIKHGADAGVALGSEDIDRTSYRRAVEEVLRIVLEVNQFSGDDRLGAKLLLRGLTGIPKGEVKGLFEPLETYYDQNKIGGEVSFSERMAAFSDERRLYEINEITVSKNSPKKKTREVIGSVSYEEARQKDRWMDRKSFSRSRRIALRWPMHLIETTFRNGVTDSAYEKVLANEGARREMGLMVESYYRNYARAIKKWLEETKKRGVVPSVAAAASEKS